MKEAEARGDLTEIITQGGARWAELQRKQAEWEAAKNEGPKGKGAGKGPSQRLCSLALTAIVRS